MKQGDTFKVYIIEKVNRYGSVYRSELCPNKWSTNFENADIYKDKQACKNEAARLVDEQLKDIHPNLLFNEIRVRELEIKFLN